jgi:hypothetical protein
VMLLLSSIMLIVINTLTLHSNIRLSQKWLASNQTV